MIVNERWPKDSWCVLVRGAPQQALQTEPLQLAGWDQHQHQQLLVATLVLVPVLVATLVLVMLLVMLLVMMLVATLVPVLVAIQQHQHQHSHQHRRYPLQHHHQYQRHHQHQRQAWVRGPHRRRQTPRRSQQSVRPRVAQIRLRVVVQTLCPLVLVLM